MKSDDPSITALQEENRLLQEKVAELRRTADELALWQKIAQATLDTLPELVFVRDSTNRIILVNDSYAALLNLPKEKLVGVLGESLFPPEAVARYYEADRRVIEAGRAIVGEEDVPLDGAVLTYETTKFPIYGDGGGLLALGGVARDITERKTAASALQSSQAILQAVLDGSPNLIFAKDKEGRYIVVNERTARALQRTPQEVLGKTDGDLFPKDVADFLQARDKRVIETGEPTEREELIEHHDGEHVYWTSTYPLRSDDGAVFAVCAIATDITERKREEAERERLQDRVIKTQASALRELSTPLIPLADRVVIMPLIGTIDSARAEQALQTLLHGAAQHRAEIAILDITGVSNVDAEVASALVRAAKAVELLGAKTILTGVRPEVAQVLVTLGFDLGGIVTSGTLQSGVAYALARVGALPRAP